MSDGQRKRGRPSGEEREQRRDEILDAAVGLFLEHGYGGVSLDRLASTAKVTKRTIYAYVGDKPEVFAAVVARLSSEVMPADRPGKLRELAARLVMTLHSDEAIALHRIVIAESRQFPELASAFYANGPRRYIDVLAERLDGDGAAAEHLFALLLGEPHRRRLLDLDPAPSKAQARKHATSALTALGL